ncbi:hypothetical protein, partial [Cetobacterium sp.]|uniref:hypothetical protein n=1 Tax=Cetobacterium sp. TaxID=2071632 RepID=UPI003EE5A4D7
FINRILSDYIVVSPIAPSTPEVEVKVETHREKFARIAKQAHALTKILKSIDGSIDYRTQYGLFFKELYRKDNFDKLRESWHTELLVVAGLL